MEAQANSQYEKRHDVRIPGDKLPQSIKTLTVNFGEESQNYAVRTIDASVSGISFRVDIPAYSIQDYNLTIRASDSSFVLQDELVYAKPIDANTSRVSVHLSSQSDLEKYRAQVKDAGR